uniref:glycosyltransferase family 32 protein n=1 Tax=Pseudoclavibacter sp. RFBI5 TaxID=2080578 RepID=UPI0015E3AB16|nr:glycosyltransferase [Pseudoclavibacter sp. RFBI5]
MVQFWDNSRNIPTDVQACMDSWKVLETAGFRCLLFDDITARRYIVENYDSTHAAAFDLCRHPAMRADYFRLCYVLRSGGVYVDADDEYQGVYLEEFIADGRLHVQALCYDLTANSMVPVDAAVNSNVNDKQIFYVNNNPLIAGPGHPAIESALEQATSALNVSDRSDRDVQSTTGPGNLTRALVRHSADLDSRGDFPDFWVMTRWDDVAVSKWPLAYREDGRNWRHWSRGVDLPHTPSADNHEQA